MCGVCVCVVVLTGAIIAALARWLRGLAEPTIRFLCLLTWEITGGLGPQLTGLGPRALAWHCLPSTWPPTRHERGSRHRLEFVWCHRSLSLSSLRRSVSCCPAVCLSRSIEASGRSLSRWSPLPCAIIVVACLPLSHRWSAKSSAFQDRERNPVI
eukprot:SAG31_NODE_11331_length_1041_cov_19.021231_1_plen_155_part_00